MNSLKKLLVALTFIAFLSACTEDQISPTTFEDEVELDAFLNTDEILIQEDAIVQAIGMEEDTKGNDISKSNRASRSGLYTMSNEASGNQVIHFEIIDGGTISEVARFDTYGTGNDASLGNQGALALSRGGRLLFVVNPGSDDFSAFFVRRNGRLVFLDKVHSGGTRPVSVTYRAGLIYVVNAGSDNIVGFAFNRRGKLRQLRNSSRALSATGTAPAQISFSRNGRALIVTEKATNTISSYALRRNGRPGNINTLASAGITPFGFDLGNGRLFHVSEAAGGADGASTVTTYRINNHGIVSVVDGPLATQGTAACWVVSANNNTDLFVTNTGGADISALTADASGNLSISNGGNRIATGNGPLDAARDSQSRYLYVLAGADNTIVSYRIGQNGQLTQIDLDGGLTDRASGLVVTR